MNRLERWLEFHQRLEIGAAMVETAVAFPLLIIVALGLVQFALYAHAQNVVVGAAQDGARVAAAEDRHIEDGLARAHDLLRAGLGPSAEGVSVRGVDGGDVVMVETQGRLRLILPWVGDASLPLHAQAMINKEAFHASPSR
ncbi:MAG: TadE family protein [Anaerolineae bacterium]